LGCIAAVAAEAPNRPVQHRQLLSRNGRLRIGIETSTAPANGQSRSPSESSGQLKNALTIHDLIAAAAFVTVFYRRTDAVAERILTANRMSHFNRLPQNMVVLAIE